MTETRIFTGGLDYDSSPYLKAKNTYADALNITRDQVAGDADLVATNIVGNRLVPYAKPAGTNKVIGAKADRNRNRVYEFMWNSGGNHTVLFYDNTTRTRTKLIEDLTDTGGFPVLNFNVNKKILHIDIIPRPEGDLLCWTDDNSAPRKINVDRILAGTYGVIKPSFVEVAKRPFLSAPSCTYGSDATRNANSLRRKMFQFSARPCYDDFDKASWSTYSKIPLPVGFYGSDNDTDNTKNNYITINVETGDKNVKRIEIAMRFSIEAAWSQFVLVASIDKTQLSIPDNATYALLFYNDSVYPPIDLNDILPLYDWAPRLAKGQVLANGNVLIYGAITEDYDNYPASQLQVTLTAANVTNQPPDTNPPTFTWNVIAGPPQTWVFVVNGSVPLGTHYTIIANPGGVSQTFADYTSIGGDTINTVASALRAYILAHFPGYTVTIILGGNAFTVVPPGGSGFSTVATFVVPGTSSGIINTEKTWLWNANYIFGIVYVDEQNRDMPGVITLSNPAVVDTDFVVTTPSFSQSSGVPQTPVITFTINHIPPAGAVKFYIVRRRMTYANPLMYETCDYQDGSDGFLYFSLANIDQYKSFNTQFIYPSAPVTIQSRIKIIAEISGSAYTSNIYNQDYEILGTVTKKLTGGTSPQDDKLFIKVKKPTGAIVPAYTAHMLVMLYEPMENPTDLADSVYWEWGEDYDIYTPDGGAHYYHRGKNRDQTGIQSAQFIWPEGDVYFHIRTMYKSILSGSPFTSDTVPVMDANFSDFFLSGVNDNGRGQVIAVDAKNTYAPTKVRFGGEFESDSNVNNLNRFSDADFDVYDLSFGDIMKMSVYGRIMDVAQRYKIGFVPIEGQIIKTAQGSDALSISNKLINPIQYYEGDYGVGDAPGSWTQYNFARYFCDTNRGVVCRLSRDGIIPISILYHINSWANLYISMRKGNYHIYGVYDPKSNNYIFAMESVRDGISCQRYSLTCTPDEIAVVSYTDCGSGNTATVNMTGGQTTQICAVEGSVIPNPFVTVTLIPGTTCANSYTHDTARTMAFDEDTNQFESQLSFAPDFMCSLGTLLITWKDGDLWTHDSSTYNNFYGVQYESFVEPVFNLGPDNKKNYLANSQVSSTVWAATDIETSLGQESSLQSSDYRKNEDGRYAGFLRDINSPNGLLSGDPLKGNWIKLRLTAPASVAGNLVSLFSATVYSADSPANYRK